MSDSNDNEPPPATELNAELLPPIEENNPEKAASPESEANNLPNAEDLDNKKENSDQKTDVVTKTEPPASPKEKPENDDHPKNANIDKAPYFLMSNESDKEPKGDHLDDKHDTELDGFDDEESTPLLSRDVVNAGCIQRYWLVIFLVTFGVIISALCGLMFYMVNNGMLDSTASTNIQDFINNALSREKIDPCFNLSVLNKTSLAPIINKLLETQTQSDLCPNRTT